LDHSVTKRKTEATMTTETNRPLTLKEQMENLKRQMQEMKEMEKQLKEEAKLLAKTPPLPEGVEIETFKQVTDDGFVEQVAIVATALGSVEIIIRQGAPSFSANTHAYVNGERLVTNKGAVTCMKMSGFFSNFDEEALKSIAKNIELKREKVTDEEREAAIANHKANLKATAGARIEVLRKEISELEALLSEPVATLVEPV
jgi:hypothetical protein